MNSDQPGPHKNTATDRDVNSDLPSFDVQTSRGPVHVDAADADAALLMAREHTGGIPFGVEQTQGESDETETEPTPAAATAPTAVRAAPATDRPAMETIPATTAPAAVSPGQPASANAVLPQGASGEPQGTAANPTAPQAAPEGELGFDPTPASDAPQGSAPADTAGEW